MLFACQCHGDKPRRVFNRKWFWVNNSCVPNTLIQLGAYMAAR
ncbi:hypothetical protein PGR6_36480 [Pseudomonas sp. GR 6-02]|nr:hypothetical protein PGR6_36480 [Pseudomonas sp. GR 6-02]